MKHAGWQLFTVIISYDENKNSTEFGLMEAVRKIIETDRQEMQQKKAIDLLYICDEN